MDQAVQNSMNVTKQLEFVMAKQFAQTRSVPLSVPVKQVLQEMEVIA